MMAPLKGELALVTGASRGIGSAIAVRLAELGADLALVQRGDAAETAARIRELGRDCLVLRSDLSDPLAADRAVAELVSRTERLDIVVCNAGGIHREPALDVPLETWREIIDLNLVSTFAVSRAAARWLVDRGLPGRIVQVASVLAFQGGLNVSAYAASKAAVANLTRALANEWAPLGIRVNAVAPGYIENEQTLPLRHDPVRSEQIRGRIPAGRWGRDDDVADAVAFLVSAQSAYLHGHVLAVDGGWLGR